MLNLNEYFATARERYLISLRRGSGQERPWTQDPIFSMWRFCNVHREDDRTTKWFRSNVRLPLAGKSAEVQLRATLIFRWFNRIETGEKILDIIHSDWDPVEVCNRLKDEHPVCTGAYMIRSPEGMSKLDGIVYSINESIPQLGMAEKWGSSLEEAWRDLLPLYGVGPFIAYEIVSDLRWTILSEAEDINTWANAGPGCARGLGRVMTGHRRQFNRHKDQEEMLLIMRELLEHSRNPVHWPYDDRPWEMREVEHWACEFEKYCSAYDGNRLKRRFK